MFVSSSSSSATAAATTRPSSYRLIGHAFTGQQEYRPTLPTLDARRLFLADNGLDKSRLALELRDKVITIQRMSQAELHYVFNHWVPKQGWYPAQHGIEALYDADKNGYYLLFVDNEPAASLAAVRDTATKLAFLGLYITENDKFRNKGVGKLLWDAVTKQLLAEGYTLGLNAVTNPTNPALNKAAMYEKDGFSTTQVDEVFVYSKPEEVVIRAQEVRPFPSIHKLPNESGPAVNADSHAALDHLIQFDYKSTGLQRREFLLQWLFKPRTSVRYATDENGAVVGYGVLSERVSPKQGEVPGHRIGGLYALNEQIAARLIQGLINDASMRPVQMDASGANPKAAKLLTELGFTRAAGLACMWKPARAVEQCEENTYGKTSLAIFPR